MTTADPASTGLYDAGVTPELLDDRLRDGQWTVAVYGLGKMGLPIASVFADVTGAVTGVDVDPTVVDRVNDGDSPVRGEPGLDDLVAEQVAAGRLSATDRAEVAAAEAAIHVVIVPTSIGDGNRPDIGVLLSVVEAIGTGIEPGDLVLVESTVPPYTCRRVVSPTVASAGGLDSDEFGVAFCPERTASGRALEDIRGAYPRIVGGLDAESTRLAELIYAEITDNEVIAVADAVTAECVKLFEGVYRDVNIALANELATFGAELDVDVRAAIEAANTQPYCDLHSPGPGVGGHCIPYYPWFLVDELRTPSRLLRMARYVNERMPAFTADRCADLLEGLGVAPERSTVLILGVAYRPDVAEAAASPAIGLAANLAGHGATVYAADPVLPDLPPIDAEPIELDEGPSVDPDLVAVVTPHTAFESIEWTAYDDPLVVDCRDGLDANAIPLDVWTLGSS